jgi:hypothetical protein
MPYHPDSTTRALFIDQHIHTPDTLEEVLCSICRQRCTGHAHEVVQIAGHPHCQCVFGRSCLLQWLRSGSAASNTCPSCRAVLFKPQAVGPDGDSDSNLSSGSEDEDDDLPVLPSRGRPCARTAGPQRTHRGTAPSPSPSRSASSSSEEENVFQTPLQHRYNLRSCRPSPSRTLSVRAAPDVDIAIDNLVDDLWAGTWDLVTESWDLTPDDAVRSRSITHAQLVMLILDVYPFEEEVDGGACRAVIKHLVVRARKMVVKHRRNEVFDGQGGLRAEREDVRLAVGYGI